MKVLIADYKESMMPKHDLERQVLTAGLANCEIEVYEYTAKRRAEFLAKLAQVDALLTAFIPLDRAALAQAG